MLMKMMKAITIADDLVEFLENHSSYLARVHSVFRHSVNLLINKDELITLTNQSEITPMGLTVDSIESFTKYLQPGDDLILDVDQFRSADGCFFLQLRNAQVWESTAMTNLALRPVDQVDRVNLQLSEWLGRQPALGLLPLLPRLTKQTASNQSPEHNIYSRYIADDLEAFTNAIAADEWELALKVTDRLVGFGMGSTPSCDDFLAAYLVVFRIAEKSNLGFFPWVSEFNETIAKKAKKGTTLISANMLRHAGNGKVSRSHQRLVQTCLFNDISDTLLLASQVLQHGATSGGDFLLGLVCALAWYRNSILDYQKEGVNAWVDLKQSQLMPIL